MGRSVRAIWTDRCQSCARLFRAYDTLEADGMRGVPAFYQVFQNARQLKEAAKHSQPAALLNALRCFPTAS